MILKFFYTFEKNSKKIWTKKDKLQMEKVKM